MRRLLLSTLALATVLATAAPASAIPAFARKYRVSCSLCHSPAPRLNEFGETFASNGFQFQPGEEPRDTVDTGDDLLSLMDHLPLAVRFDGYIQTRFDAPSDQPWLDLQTPFGIKLLSGGPIFDNISYYMYFYMSERGEIAGLEDAYVQFTEVFGSPINLMAGQFQVSDPLFKRELRLEAEDYAAYRVRVGDARADLTYDRGLMATWSPWEGGDLVLQLVNGTGLEEATDRRTYDRDSGKAGSARFSQAFGPVRLGGFFYYGQETQRGIVDEVRVAGPDATLQLGQRAEVNLQLLRRWDDHPFFAIPEPLGETVVDAAMAELIYMPQGPAGRVFFTGLVNWVSADAPVFSVRLGEAEDLIADYRTFAVGGHYLLARNLRLLAEGMWNAEEERAFLTIGGTAAF